jgi:hypothetical protein
MPSAAARHRSLEAEVARLDPLEPARLTETLERLEATAADAITRWSTPDDFAKVDLVVTKLLQEANAEAALMYVRKVRCPSRVLSLAHASGIATDGP